MFKMKICIFTICSNNYLAQAFVLRESVKRIYGNEATFLFVIADLPSKDVSYFDGYSTFLFAKDIGIDNFDYYSMKYDVIELNTFLKPYVFAKLLPLYDMVVYLDPDMVVFDRIDASLALLTDEKPIGLTPHKLSMLPAYDQNETDILKSGYFNLGFCAIRGGKKGSEFVNYWKSELADTCYSDIANHQFTDQKCVSDLSHFFCDEIIVFGDPGINYGPWNFCERKLLKEEGKWVVELVGPGKFRSGSLSESSLKIFHFSGFKVDGGNVYFSTKHHSMDFDSFPLMKSLFDEYRTNLLSFNFSLLSKTPYAFERFENGLFVSRFERRLFAYCVNEGIIPKTQDPFKTSSDFFVLLKRNRLLTKNSLSKFDHISLNAVGAPSFSKKRSLILSSLALLKKAIGVSNYVLLSKYALYQLQFKNQGFLIRKFPKRK